jgi:hypothetical protein
MNTALLIALALAIWLLWRRENRADSRARNRMFKGDL